MAQDLQADEDVHEDGHNGEPVTEERLLEVNDDALRRAGLGCLLADAVEFAEKSPEPDASESVTDVFS
jgi:hypothetical protein